MYSTASNSRAVHENSGRRHPLQLCQLPLQGGFRYSLIPVFILFNTCVSV
jgi:hypothetical protein